MTTKQNRVIIVLRWIAAAPGALLVSWLAWILVVGFGRFGLKYYAMVESDSFLAQLYFNTIGHGAMGAAFVYVGARIAPAHHRVIAYILACLGVVLSGLLLFPAIMAVDFWAFWGAICTAIGAGGVTYFIHKGETDVK
jgi:hypothetical protein